MFVSFGLQGTKTGSTTVIVVVGGIVDSGDRFGRRGSYSGAVSDAIRAAECNEPGIFVSLIIPCSLVVYAYSFFTKMNKYAILHLWFGHYTSNSSVVAPSNAGTKTSVRHVIFSSANFLTMTSAIFSKLCVASASIVGPAPERQIPSNPG